MNFFNGLEIAMGIIFSSPLLASIFLCAITPDSEPGLGRIDLAKAQAIVKVVAPIFMISFVWVLKLIRSDLTGMIEAIPYQLMTILWVAVVTTTVSSWLIRNIHEWGNFAWRGVFFINGLFIIEIIGVVVFMNLSHAGYLPF